MEIMRSKENPGVSAALFPESRYLDSKRVRRDPMEDSTELASYGT